MGSESQNDQDIVSLLQSLDPKPRNTPSDFRERVMQEIRQSPAAWEGASQKARSELSEMRSSRRSFGWRRMATYTVVACFGLFAIALWSFERIAGRHESGQGVVQGAQRSSSAASQLVRFVIVAPEAEQVSLAGSFNGWQVNATPLRRINAAGTWMVDVPLATGQYSYMFVINGEEWVPDLTAPSDGVAEFGRSNSVITVVAGRTL